MDRLSQPSHDSFPFPSPPDDVDLGFDLPEEQFFCMLGGFLREDRTGLLGEYQIEIEVGRGGQGVVYRAIQPRTGRTVALKRTPRPWSTKRDRAGFDREVQAAAALNHPNIVTVYGCEDIDGALVMTMEYIEGVPISRWAACGTAEPPGKAQRRSIDEILRSFVKICDAVSHAHQRGVIHRDLKPSNVLMDADGEPHILDFGLARLAGRDDFSLHTQMIGFAGTPAYAPPEQFDSPESEIDVRTDVYAIGAMLFESLTGHPPHGLTEGYTELFEMTRTRDAPPLSSIRPEAGFELDAIVRTALARDKAQRYQSVSALGDDIRRLLAGEVVLACPPSIRYQLGKFARRYRFAFLSSLLLLFLISGFAIVTGNLAVREHQARIEAQLQRDFAEQQAYRAALAGAEGSLRAGDVVGAKRSLEQAPASLRGWEWRHYANRLDDAEWVFQCGSSVLEYGVDFSPDGQQLAVLCRDATLQIWDLQSGKRLTRINTPVSIGTGVRFSPDGTIIACCGTEQFISLFDAITYREIARLVGHTARINTIAFAKDGARLASASSDGTIRVWNMQTVAASFADGPKNSVWYIQQAEHVLRMANEPGDEVRVFCLGFAQGGRRIYASSYSDRLCYWDLDTVEPQLSTLDIDRAPVVRFALSPDEKWLAYTTLHGSFHILPLAEGVKGMTYPTSSGIDYDEIAISPQGNLIAAIGRDYSVRTWNIPSGQQRDIFLGHISTPDTARFSRDGTRIATAGNDGTARIWNIHPKGTAKPQRIHEKARIERVLVHPRYPFLIISTGARYAVGYTISVWDPHAQKELATLHTNTFRDSAANHHIWEAGYPVLSPDNRWILVESGDGTILGWDADALAERLPRAENETTPQTIAPTLRLREAHPPERSVAAILAQAICMSGDGRYIAAGSQNDTTIRLWDMETRTVVARLNGHSAGIMALTTLPDGSSFASGSRDHTVKIWDWNTRTHVATLEGHTNHVRALACHPDGSMLASASFDRTIKIWNLRTHREVRTLHGHSNLIWSIAFSPDGSRLISGSFDRAIGVWDPYIDEPLTLLHGHSKYVLSVDFTTDGASIISGSADGTIRFWDGGPNRTTDFVSNQTAR